MSLDGNIQLALCGGLATWECICVEPVADALRIQMTPAQRIALRRAARNGEYNLMLGAGASLDSKHAGTPLPGSAKLIQELCATFGVISEDDDLLWRVYDRAVETAGSDAVYSWFRKRFWNVTPPYWMNYYARSPWSTVWTLNVDDTFEAAYKGVSSETSKALDTLNWDDDYKNGRRLNVVHLHGVVDRDEPRNLVFSLSEYAGSAAARAAWPTNFRDTYGNSPFVILGARLRDEPDIEAVISRRNPVHPAPSFYVARTISPATKADMRRWGLIPLEMSAEDFVLEWAELTGLKLEDGLASDLELGIRVGQQFTELHEKTTYELEDGHDFLGGDEPTWADVQGELPAELEWVTNAKFDLNQIGQSVSSSSVLAYIGRRLTGRSTGLLQLARHLRSGAWRTFYFKGSGRLDIDALLGFAVDGKSVALIFDGVADISDDVDRLITEARGAGLSLICVAVENADREANIVGRIQATNLAHGRVATINERLTSVDATRLVDKLEKVGRLGALETRSDKSRSAHFRHNELFDSLAQLENAPGFGRRVNDLLSAVDSIAKVELVLLASYASYVDHQLLVIDAARMAGMDSDELVRQIQHDPQLSSLLFTNGERVRTRHRWMALSPIVERLGSQAAASIVADAVRSVSGRLSQLSLRERNPTALVVGAFMKQRNLRRVFPGANLDSWYLSLLDIFGDWSARYWEQRAILARTDSRDDVALLARAESFALRAAELVPDTYSFTTLGTVLLEKAARAQVDVSDYYDRASAAFERAAQSDSGGGTLVTWIAFLRYAVKVLERVTSAQSDESSVDARQLQDRVRDDWVRVYAQLATARESSERIGRDLSDLRRAYDAIPS